MHYLVVPWSIEALFHALYTASQESQPLLINNPRFWHTCLFYPKVNCWKVWSVGRSVGRLGLINSCYFSPAQSILVSVPDFQDFLHVLKCGLFFDERRGLLKIWLLDCCWPSPTQWLLVPSHTGLTTIFYFMTAQGAFRTLNSRYEKTSNIFRRSLYNRADWKVVHKYRHIKVKLSLCLIN
jgi:hypothetical protein